MLAAGAVLGGTIAFVTFDALIAVSVLSIVLILAIFALMPQPLTASDRNAWALLIIFLTLFCLYPSYVPIRLPGLPWISPIRIAAGAALIVWIYLFFASRALRPQIIAAFRQNRALFNVFMLFSLSEILSLPTAIDIEQALTRFSLSLLFWTFAFFAGLTLINSPRRLRFAIHVLVACTALQCLLGLAEAYRERSLWASILPAGFGADNEFLQRALQGTFRFGVYRVQNSFSVSLLYCEFLVIVLPFALYLLLESKQKVVRIFAALTAIAVLPAQYVSGSRLGVVGLICVFGVYGALLTVRIWKRKRSNLLVVVMVLLVPLSGLAAVGVYATSPRLQAYVVGGAEYGASNDGRREQFRAAVPLSLARPVFGYGVGMGAEVLGFRNSAGILTIDSYMLNLVLEIGYVGFIAYILMFSIAIYVGGRLYLDSESDEGKLGGAIAASLAAFLAIKIILSQTDNHTLPFLFLALLVQARRMESARREEKKMNETALQPTSDVRKRRRVRASAHEMLMRRHEESEAAAR